MPLRMGWLAALRTPLLRQGDQGEAEVVINERPSPIHL
jgi:hypothetical protein